ncbi:uncharacterized protein RCO7_07333 [Rhynchosporium graminicola]|uniref:2EXR domain-containing protein n=1 Tax=Rhynchosporium graminicola TaxID=2792576 RepID=A0A1E1L9Y2_9HELO|nr:uncharacterized protein RCO7_07333 [Rhynchosporium commune]
MDLPGAPIMVAASDDLQKINSSVVSSRLTTCQTPSEFHLFPKLTLESRRMIFEEALPNQTGQILFLDWSFESVTMKSGNNLVFHLYPDYPREHVEDLRVPLLSACSDSRKAYLKYNRDALPARSGSVIRYSADGTTVCISAFDKIGTESFNAPWESSKTAYRQMWFRDIKHLATGGSALYPHFREQRSDMEGFSNLESWAGVIDSTTSTVAATRYQTLLMERAQAQMEAYKKANPGYKGPRIFLSYLS